MLTRVLDTGSASAKKNMQCDARMLTQLEQNPVPLVRFFNWEKPALTYGHFIQPESFLEMDAVSRMGLDHARRPTGGGLLFHTCDLTFSVLVPAPHSSFSMNTLENYALINACVSQAIGDFLASRDTEPVLLAEATPAADKCCSSYCMAQPTRYDVMMGSRKVGGAAQRRTKFGFLHQGSICLALPDSTLIETVLKQGTTIAQAMQTVSYPLLGECPPSARTLGEARYELKKRLAKTIVTTLDERVSKMRTTK